MLDGLRDIARLSVTFGHLFVNLDENATDWCTQVIIDFLHFGYLSVSIFLYSVVLLFYIQLLM